MLAVKQPMMRPEVPSTYPRRASAISWEMASAASRGIAAPVIGRPTTK
jgi:hypothetical protein